MKKKIFISMLLCTSVILFAKNWIVHTSCGTDVPLTTGDDVTVNQLVNYVNLVNYDTCGVIPHHVTINP